MSSVTSLVPFDVLRKLAKMIAGNGGPITVALRVSTAGVCVFVTHVVTRMALRVALYKWLQMRIGFSHLPWVWDGRGDEERKTPAVYRMMPMMMQVDLKGGLRQYLELFRNKSDGSVRPAVYGGVSVGFDPSVTISDSRHFSEILNDLESFPKYMNFYNLLGPILGSGLVVTEGEEHRKQRKIITPVFHFASLKSAMGVIERNAIHFVDVVLPSKNFTITPDTFKTFTMGVITDYAFSGAFDKEWMERSWHTILNVFIIQNIFRIFIGDFVRYIPNPCSAYIALVRWKIRGFLAQRVRLLQDKNITHDALLKAVGTDLDDSSLGGGGPAPPRAAAAAGGPNAPASTPLSIDLGLNLADQLLLAGCPPARIVDECSTFLFAGEDTTSSLLSWAVYELSRHPDAQRRARDEVHRILGPGPAHAVPFEAVRRLEFVAAALKEALRLWPPAPLLPRVHAGRGALVVGGLTVPRGAVVELNLYAAHRDPSIWPRPDEFRPERWLLSAESAEAALRHPYAFIPFLAGPRNCVGQKFAMQEAVAMLAVLLSRFRLRPAPGAGEAVPVLVATVEPGGLAVQCVPIDFD